MLVVNRTGQRLKTIPARFFFRCGLSFYLAFLRGEGLVGVVVFFLEKHYYPFDLQVGPLLGTQGGGGGGGVGPFSTNPRIISVVIPILMCLYSCLKLECLEPHKGICDEVNDV